MTPEQYEPLYQAMLGMAVSIQIIYTSVFALVFLKTFEIARKGAESWKRG